VDDVFIVILVSILGCIGLFIGFIISHERERKREEKKKIHKTIGDKNRVGQHNQSRDDVKTTAPATST